ncbi:hypothetical protein ABZ647_31105 [Micromonospora aurantiaca]|uniref:hypothetical protein n=1 Tax=Micromonospora aurantiaca (nom. illeg.) TaxID=47850 RepID=UPI0033F3BD28
MSETLRLFADYRQLHLFDQDSEANIEEAWTNSIERVQFSAIGDAAVVVTTTNTDVLVDVETLGQPPAEDADHYDHVVEGSLHVPSGRLVVMGGTDYAPDATRFDVRPGWVRMRVSKSYLAAAEASDEHSDEDETTIERVRLQIWPGEDQPTLVLRQWPGPRRSEGLAKKGGASGPDPWQLAPPHRSAATHLQNQVRPGLRRAARPRNKTQNSAGDQGRYCRGRDNRPAKLNQSVSHFHPA